MKRPELLVCILVFFGWSAAFAQDDLRSFFGLESSVMETMVDLAFPGSTIDWEAQRLRRPDLDPEAIRFVDYSEEEWQDGLVATAAIEFSREVREIVKMALQERDLESRVSRSHVVVVRLAPDRTPVEGRTAVLDVGGVATEVQSLVVRPDLGGAEFPPIDLEFGSLHAGENWVASVIWTGRLEGNPLVASRLIPVLVSLRDTDGTVTTELLEIEEPSATELILRGQDTGFTWTFTCDPDCIVPAEEILSKYRNGPILAE